MSLIGKKVGNYEVKSQLGEGGMGAVYLGEHPLIGKKVAIKVLLEEFASNEAVVTRFFNEAKAVNDIGHPNIVDITDFGKIAADNGAEMVYFVMELLDGDSLSSRIARQPLTVDETVHIMTQCCDGLAASHKKGIVHRDLKPDNLYLVRRGADKNFVKILDFGIAKLTGGGMGNSKTRTGTVIGTPHYMSPEQCAGRGHIDHRSDIYSLGCVMYELATGRLPFPGEGFGDILVAHLTRDPEKPRELKPEIPEWLEAVILRAMQKDPAHRFQSMDEMHAAIEAKGGAVETNAEGGFVFKPLFDDHSQKINTATPTVAKPAFNSIDTEGKKKTPTTLSGAAAEIAAGQPKKSNTALFAVAGAAVVVLGIGGMVALKGGGAPAPVPSAGPPVAAVVEPEFVMVTIKSDPAGAMVERADRAEGGRLTPAVFRLKKGDPSFDVQIKLAGHKTQVRSVTADKNREIEVMMVKDAPAVAATPTEDAPKVKKTRKATPPPGHHEDDLKTLPPVF